MGLPDSPAPTVSMPPQQEPRAAARTAPVLLLLGALLYTSWTAEAVLPTGLSPLHSYVSELAAEGEPYGAFFRTADLLAGLLFLAGAVTALLWQAPRGWALAGWAGLALFGAATAADSRLPLSCAPTASAGCAAREAAGDVPWTHAAHAFSSGLAVAGALLAMAACTLAARRSADRWPVLASAGPALLAAQAVATAWTLAAVAAFSAGRGTWGLGAGQRLQVLVVAVWIAVLAWSLMTVRERRT